MSARHKTAAETKDLKKKLAEKGSVGNCEYFAGLVTEGQTVFLRDQNITVWKYSSQDEILDVKMHLGCLLEGGWY